MLAEVTVLYDSLCPVCRREVAFLSWVDRKRALRFVDITAPSFEPSAYGLTLEDAVGSLRGIDRDGTPIEGMATIRAMYRAANLGVLTEWTAWPVAAPLCDAAYRLFARWRPRFSRFKPNDCETSRCATKPVETPRKP